MFYKEKLTRGMGVCLIRARFKKKKKYFKEAICNVSQEAL